MPDENDYSLRIGRIEDKFALHEPILVNLHNIISISDEIRKINAELQVLRDSKIATQERLVAMLNDQEKNYKSILKTCSDKNDVTTNCPIKTVVTRIDVLEVGLANMDKTIDRLKMTGWDILLRSVPWLLLFGVTLWVAVKS